jgi:transporter family protein
MKSGKLSSESTILNAMWLVYAFLSSITAALVAIFGKLGLKGIDSTLATTIRALIMAAFLVIISLFLKKFEGFSMNSFSSKDWLLIALSGIAGALSWLFYFFALKYGLATKVVVIDRLSLVFVIILAAIFLGEALGWKSVLGALLMIAGALLIMLK